MLFKGTEISESQNKKEPSQVVHGSLSMLLCLSRRVTQRGATTQLCVRSQTLHLLKKPRAQELSYFVLCRAAIKGIQINLDQRSN